jgi:hypothetical protein
MPTIKLGSRPKSFDRTVKFKDLDGTEMAVPVSFKYRTRKEYAAFIDELAEAAGLEKPVGADGQKVTMTALLSRSDESNVEYLMRVLEGWKLETEFSRDAVTQMVDEFPGAANAVMEDYRMAVTEGRLGN